MRSGPRRTTCRHAVTISGTDTLTDPSGFDPDPNSGTDVLGNTVLTEHGTALGEITDVLIDVGRDADVVEFEIVTTDALPPGGRRALIPRPAGFGTSGEVIVVPDSTPECVANDVAGFAAIMSSRPTREAGAR